MFRHRRRTTSVRLPRAGIGWRPSGWYVQAVRAVRAAHHSHRLRPLKFWTARPLFAPASRSPQGLRRRKFCVDALPEAGIARLSGAGTTLPLGDGVTPQRRYGQRPPRALVLSAAHEAKGGVADLANPEVADNRRITGSLAAILEQRRLQGVDPDDHQGRRRRPGSAGSPARVRPVAAAST